MLLYPVLRYSCPVHPLAVAIVEALYDL